MGSAATVVLGIAVSQATRDACLLRPDGTTREAAYANTPQGFTGVAAWADRHGGGAALHCCLEATGPSSAGQATHRADAGRLVRVVNPTRVKDAGLRRGRGNQTDAADARRIAE